MKFDFFPTGKYWNYEDKHLCHTNITLTIVKRKGFENVLGKRGIARVTSSPFSKMFSYLHIDTLGSYSFCLVCLFLFFVCLKEKKTLNMGHTLIEFSYFTCIFLAHLSTMYSGEAFRITLCLTSVVHRQQYLDINSS